MSIRLRIPFVEGATICPSGMYHYGRCYWYHSQAEKMEEARTRCKSHNDDETNIRQYQYDIVSIQDEIENEFIKEILEVKGDRNPYTLPWIGLYKSGSRSWNEPEWLDGSLVLYSKWAPAKPSDYKVCIKS